MLLSYKAGVSGAGEDVPLKRGILMTTVVDIPRFEGAPSPATNASPDAPNAKNRWFFFLIT